VGGKVFASLQRGIARINAKTVVDPINVFRSEKSKKNKQKETRVHFFFTLLATHTYSKIKHISPPSSACLLNKLDHACSSSENGTEDAHDYHHPRQQPHPPTAEWEQHLLRHLEAIRSRK
jgi:hypothetical protein